MGAWPEAEFSLHSSWCLRLFQIKLQKKKKKTHRKAAQKGVLGGSRQKNTDFLCLEVSEFPADSLSSAGNGKTISIHSCLQETAVDRGSLSRS